MKNPYLSQVLSIKEEVKKRLPYGLETTADLLGVGRTTILKDLRILKEQYGVRYEGPSKTGKWVIHTINKAKLMAKT